MKSRALLEKTKDGVRISVFAQPNGKKSEVLGVMDNAVKIRLQAPPVEGKANESLIEFLSELFKVRKNQVLIVRGETSRQKVVEIIGVELQQVGSALGIEGSL